MVGLGQPLLRQAEDVVVVGPGQPFVPGDDHIAHLALLQILALVKEPVLGLGGVVEDVGDGLIDLGKEGGHSVQLLPRLAQFGGGDQVHGVGDFQGLLHTVNACADLLHACHQPFTCF